MLKDVTGTAIAIDGRAVLLRGPSGSGKSDLAFRSVTQEGALLVGDDHVDLDVQAGQLIVSPKPGWAGKLELRGLGIVLLPALEQAPLCLVVNLIAREKVPRLPEPAFDLFEGCRIPRLQLHAFDISSPAKLRVALGSWPDNGFPGDDGQIN